MTLFYEFGEYPFHHKVQLVILALKTRVDNSKILPKSTSRSGGTFSRGRDSNWEPIAARQTIWTLKPHHSNIFLLCYSSFSPFQEVTSAMTIQGLFRISSRKTWVSPPRRTWPCTLGIPGQTSFSASLVAFSLTKYLEFGWERLSSRLASLSDRYAVWLSWRGVLRIFLSHFCK